MKLRRKQPPTPWTTPAQPTDHDRKYQTPHPMNWTLWAWDLNNPHTPDIIEIVQVQNHDNTTWITTQPLRPQHNNPHNHYPRTHYTLEILLTHGTQIPNTTRTP